MESVVTRERTNPFLVAGGLLAAFGVYQRVMRSWLESEPNKAYTAEHLEQVLYHYWSRFSPHWKTMVQGLIYTAARRGMREAGITLPEVLLTTYANEYTRTLGEYLHHTTVEAMTKGYNALTNRRLPNLSALNFVTKAIGVTPRVMNSLVTVWTSEDPKAYTDVKQPSQRNRRAQTIINAGLKQRAEVMSGHEEWNAKEQSKQISWQWAVVQGILAATAIRQWVTADDEKVCVYCGALDGAEVRVKEQFETDAGAFWNPPLHPNCRCTVKLINAPRKVRRREVAKAYEDRPWVRFQPRNEDGEWVKTGTPTQERAPLQPLILPPVAWAEKLTLPPSGAEKLRLPPPAEKLAFPQKLSLPQEKLELPQDVKLTLPAQKLELPTQQTEKLSLPAPVEPELDLPEPTTGEVVFDSEDIAQPLDLRAMNPQRYVNLVNMEEGGRLRPAYGIISPDYDLDEMHTYRPRGLRMVHDFDELNEMVQDHITTEVDLYLEFLEEEHGGKIPLKISEDGQQATISRHGVEEAFEWLRAKDQRMHTVNYGTVQSGPVYDSDQFITVQIGGSDRTVRASRVVADLKLDDALESFRPNIVTTTRYDADQSDVDYGTTRNQDLEYRISGPHQVVEMTDHVIDDDGTVIPARVFEIDPFDYVDDGSDSDYYD